MALISLFIFEEDGLIEAREVGFDDTGVSGQHGVINSGSSAHQPEGNIAVGAARVDDGVALVIGLDDNVVGLVDLGAEE